jgi:hypothetical protein
MKTDKIFFLIASILSFDRTCTSEKRAGAGAIYFKVYPLPEMLAADNGNFGL